MASVLQGSVLEPLLWNVYSINLLQLIPEVSAYADYCTVSFTSSKSPNMSLQDTGNHILIIVVKWSKNGKLKLHLRRRRRER